MMNFISMDKVTKTSMRKFKTAKSLIKMALKIFKSVNKMKHHSLSIFKLNSAFGIPFHIIKAVKIIPNNFLCFISQFTITRVAIPIHELQQ